MTTRIVTISMNFMQAMRTMTTANMNESMNPDSQGAVPIGPASTRANETGVTRGTRVDGKAVGAPPPAPSTKPESPPFKVTVDEVQQLAEGSDVPWLACRAIDAVSNRCAWEKATSSAGPLHARLGG